MKHFSKIITVLITLLLTCSFIGCSHDSSSNGGNPQNTGEGSSTDTTDSNTSLLPNSVGINELLGKTYERVYLESYGYKAMETIKFSNDVIELKNDLNGTVYYKYAYNSTTKLLYLLNTSLSSVDDYEKSLRASEDNITEDILEFKLAERLSELNLISIKKYVLSDDGKKITLSNYFDGNLPTDAFFQHRYEFKAETDVPYYWYDDIEREISSTKYGFSLYSLAKNSAADINKQQNWYDITASFSENKFAGNLYSGNLNIVGPYVCLGEVSGTVTITGNGTENSVIKLSFTKFPENNNICFNIGDEFELTQKLVTNVYELKE